MRWVVAWKSERTSETGQFQNKDVNRKEEDTQVLEGVSLLDWRGGVTKQVTFSLGLSQSLVFASFSSFLLFFCCVLVLGLRDF